MRNRRPDFELMNNKLYVTKIPAGKDCSLTFQTLIKHQNDIHYIGFFVDVLVSSVAKYLSQNFNITNVKLKYFITKIKIRFTSVDQRQCSLKDHILHSTLFLKNSHESKEDCDSLPYQQFFIIQIAFLNTVFRQILIHINQIHNQSKYFG